MGRANPARRQPRNAVGVVVRAVLVAFRPHKDSAGVASPHRLPPVPALALGVGAPCIRRAPGRGIKVLLDLRAVVRVRAAHGVVRGGSGSHLAKARDRVKTDLELAFVLVDHLLVIRQDDAIAIEERAALHIDRHVVHWLAGQLDLDVGRSTALDRRHGVEFLDDHRWIVVSDGHHDIVDVDVLIVGVLKVDVLRHHVVVHVRILAPAKHFRLVDIIVPGCHDDSLRRVPVGTVENELRSRRQVPAPRRPRSVARQLPVPQIGRGVAAVDGVLYALAAVERARSRRRWRRGGRGWVEDVHGPVDAIRVSQVAVRVAQQPGPVAVTAIGVDARCVPQHRRAVGPDTEVRISGLAAGPVRRGNARRPGPRGAGGLAQLHSRRLRSCRRHRLQLAGTVRPHASNLVPALNVLQPRRIFAAHRHAPQDGAGGSHHRGRRTGSIYRRYK